jgi:hypothetical protein
MKLHQIKKFLHQRKQLPETKDNPQNGRKYLPGIQQIKDYYPEYIEN